jgi:hypothetical protein
MEKYYEFGVDLHLVFIDYKQAYDSIDRSELWKGLERLGIPGMYVNLIKMCREKTICKIRFLQNDSEPFKVKTGLCQGGALSSTLFNLAFERIVRDIHEQRQMKISEDQ